MWGCKEQYKYFTIILDNLRKRGVEKPPLCQFCCEPESVQHLFYDCIVAKQAWKCVSDFNGVVINSYTDMARKWIADKKIKSTNTISAGVVWCLWLIRNDFVFRGQKWSDIKLVFRKLWTCMKPLLPTSSKEDICNGTAKLKI